MRDLFLTVLSMSLISGLAALVVLFLRGSLGRVLPRTFSYALWLILLCRTICPFSFPFGFSLMGRVRQGLDTYTSTLKAVSLKDALDFEVLSGHRVQELGLVSYPSGGAMMETADGLTAAPLAAAPAQADYFTMAVILLWLLGILALLLYNVLSYGRLCRSMAAATLFEDSELVAECKAALRMGKRARVYASDRAESPFVYGILRPKVVLPVSAAHPAGGQGRERLRHILLHELYHIKRFDYLVKPLALLALCFHWFNPVLWIAFRLLNKDMEMSCDEGVIKALKADAGADYAETLLDMASARNGIRKSYAVAFFETNVGERVKHIVKYRKPGPAAGIIAAIILVLCAAVLLSNPAPLTEELAKEPEGKQANILVMCGAEGSAYPDIILLLGYNGDREQVNVAFLPGDLQILPDDGKMGNSEKRLYGFAGKNPPEAVAEKLSEILGVKIHNFVRFDTSVFRYLVDAAGGVEFDLPIMMVYEDPYQNLRINLEKGRRVLDGKSAEMLVRYQRGYSEGDLARIETLKAFLEAMIEQKSDMKTDSFQEIYQALSGKVDTDLDAKTARNLITLFFTGESTAFVDLPFEKASSGSMAPLLLSRQAKEALKEKF